MNGITYLFVVGYFVVQGSQRSVHKIWAGAFGPEHILHLVQVGEEVHEALRVRRHRARTQANDQTYADLIPAMPVPAGHLVLSQQQLQPRLRIVLVFDQHLLHGHPEFPVAFHRGMIEHVQTQSQKLILELFRKNSAERKNVRHFAEEIKVI